MPPRPDSEAWAALEAEIRRRLGLVPAFFRVASGPEVAEPLWRHARAAYLDSPVPRHFREALFAYLSRFCEVPYCMVRQTAFLLGRGGPGVAGEPPLPALGPVLRLLRRPAPEAADLEQHLDALASHPAPLEAWPSDLDADPGRALFACSVQVFLAGGSRARCYAALRRSLGPERFESLVALLGFIRAAHDWTEAHPELDLEGDDRELLASQPELAAWVDRYQSVVAGERIAQRKRTEDALEKSQALSRAILDTVPDAILSIDDRGIIQHANAATTRLFGYEEAELVGRNVRMLMPPPHCEEHDGYLVRYRRTGEARIIGRGREVEGRRKDGSVFPIRLTVGEALFDHARMFTGILHDDSEVRELQQQLLQSQKMEAVGTLASGVAHDFNNLLTSIRGSSEILIDHLDPTDRLARSARRIQRAADRATALTTRLLAFSRRQVTQHRPVDVNAVVRETGEIFAHALSEDVQLKLDLAAEPLYAGADESQLGQVLMNLVVNASDAMRTGGNLTVATGRHSDGRITLRVSDSGEGIPPDRLGRIFEPFYTTKEEGKGTGLGLSTALAIVREHGGAIEVESEPGIGTTFTLLLPGIAAPALPPAPAAGSLGSGADGEAILLVEDDDIARELLAEVLSEQGYAVVATADPQDALRRAHEPDARIDLLVSDVVLPDLSGPELAREIRSRHPGVRVLFVSGYTDQALADRGALEDGTAFLRKPFGNSSLLDKVREVLDQRAG
jgi:PAS domain S-box-containing protein